MLGWRLKSPQKWGDMVRKNNRGFTGEYPRMIVYQGSSDWIVNKRNGVELMEQWTNLHSTSATQTIPQFLNNPKIERNSYRNASGREMVIFYRIAGLSHALPLDPGKCRLQGGRRGIFSRDINFNSTLWTAYDFGLISPPLISGRTEAAPGEELSFSVPALPGASYEWHFPAGCMPLNGGNNHTLQLKWGQSAGTVNATETDASGCRKQFQTILVNMKP